MQKENIGHASEDGRWLVSNSPDDKTMSSSVRNLLSAGSTPLESLERKLSDRRHKLQAAIIYGLESESALQLIKERLLNLESSSSGRLISANSDTVNQQDVENKACMKHVGELRSSLQDVTSKLGASEKGDEESSVKSALRTQSDALLSRLQDLEKVLSKRQILINDVKPLAEKFDVEKNALKGWLHKTEDDISLMEKDDVKDEAAFEESLRRLKVSSLYYFRT